MKATQTSKAARIAIPVIAPVMAARAAPGGALPGGVLKLVEARRILARWAAQLRTRLEEPAGRSGD